MAAPAPTAALHGSSTSISSSSSGGASDDSKPGTHAQQPHQQPRARRGSILHDPAAFYLMPGAGNRDSLASMSNAFTFLKVRVCVIKQYGFACLNLLVSIFVRVRFVCNCKYRQLKF
jgi:hypothetical protein